MVKAKAPDKIKKFFRVIWSDDSNWLPAIINAAGTVSSWF